MAVFQPVGPDPGTLQPVPEAAAPLLDIGRCLWRRRWLLWRFLARDLQLKYRGSALGFFWSLLGPLLLMLVYSVVFSVLVRVSTPVPYPLFVLCGLLPWLFTARSIDRAGHVLLEHGPFLQKIYCPRELLVVSAVLVQFVELVLSMAVLVLVTAFVLATPGRGLLLLPLWLGVHLLLVLGLCFVLSLGTVFFRDLLPVTGIVLQVWFYLCPVIYPASLAVELPGGWLYGLNPMAGLLEAYRAALFGTPMPAPSWLAFAVLAAALSLVVGASLFRRHEAAAVKEL